MHLKNVTKKQLTITQTCFRTTRGAGAERLGPGGRCRPRTGAVSVAPREGGPGARGALPGQGRAAEGRVLLSPLTFCNPPSPVPSPEHTEAPGPAPHRARGREGVASQSRSGPRVTCPGDRGQCQAHALALSSGGSAGTTALRGHQTTRGQDGQSSPTKATFPQAVHEGSGSGTGAQKSSRRPACNPLHKLPVSRLF